MINGQKYHVSKNLLAWEGQWVGKADLSVEYNEYVISTVIDVRNISSLYFTGDVSLMNSSVYRIGKANNPIDSTGFNKLTSFSSSFSGGVLDVSDCNYVLVSASTYGRPDSNRDLIKATYMCNTGTSPLPYEPYSSEVWHDTTIPTRKLHNATDVITSLPVDIYTEGQTIGVNLLNPASTVEVSGTTYSGQTFPAGTYYVKNANTGTIPMQSMVLCSDLDSQQGVAVPAGQDTVFTSIGDFLIYTSNNTNMSLVMVAKSSTAVPFQPYSNCTIKGNMQQSDTPTPQNTIQPQETGERTGNLFDKSMTVYNAYLTNAGYWLASSDSTSYKIPVEPNTTYTLDAGMTVAIFRISESNDINIEPNNVRTNLLTYTTNARRATITTADDTKCIIFQGSASLIDQWRESLMLNTGSQPLPYQPYGYKLDIKSGNTTTPAYLGETQSTRKIKKLVFTGDEVWDRQTPQHTNIINLYIAVDNAMSNSPIYSNIVTYFSDAGINNDSRANVGKVNSTGVNLLLDLSLSDFSSTETFKTYLRQQYAAGTPVCVWYVLATEETGIVNEPLRKIGDYADSVTATNIPTTAGGIEFDVDTSLKPSKVSLTYHGWHDISPEQYENGAWN